jgi:hypothetical protein
VAKKTVVLSAARHPMFPAPSDDATLVSDVIYRRKAYGGNLVLVTKLGVAWLLIPWDARTFAGAAVGAASGGLFPTPGPVQNILLGQLGQTAGTALMEHRTVSDQVRKGLRRKRAFVAPFLRLIEVTVLEGGWGPRVRVVEESDAGARIEHTISLEGSKPPPVELAIGIAISRAACEGAAGWKLAARELLEARGADPDQPDLNPVMPLSMGTQDCVERAGVALASVAARAHDRFGHLAADFAGYPDAQSAFLGLLGWTT